MMDILCWLQNWYHSNCDGGWEHLYGVKILNTDNPGWSVTIDLEDTEMSDKLFEKVEYDNGDDDWFFCLVKNNAFKGAGDSHKLIKILEVFKNWVESQ